MNLIESFKHNSKFRFRVIIVLLVILLVYSSGAKKEALPTADTCSSENMFKIWTDVSGCLDKGCALNAYNAWGIVSLSECGSAGFGGVLQGIGLSCSNIPKDKFLASSLTQAQTLCGTTKKAIESSDTFCLKQLYMCTDIPKEEQCSNKGEYKIAKVLFPKVIDDCNMAYNIVLIGGGFIALIFLMAAL